MALEFIKSLFKDNEALTYEDLEKAATEAKINGVNIADGSYVSRDKFNDKVGALTQQVTDLAGYVAVVLSIAVGAAYVIMAGAAVNAKMAVCLIALMFLSWLSAMVGYDKVMQAISQFKTYKKSDKED